MCAPAASVAFGHVRWPRPEAFDGAAGVSVTFTRFSAPLPVLVTRNVYLTFCPAFVTDVVVDRLWTVIDVVTGVIAVTVAEAGSDITEAGTG